MARSWAVAPMTDLLNACTAEWARVNSGSSWSSPDDNMGSVLPGVASWTQHIIYSSGAVYALHAADYRHAASPLLRQIVEHAAAVAIVAQDPERYSEYFRDTSSGMWKLSKARSDAGLPSDPGLDAFLLDVETLTLTKTGHEARFKSLGETGARLYTSWLEQTQESHASHFTATGFLKGAPDHRTLVDEPQWIADPIESLALVIDCLTMAMDYFSYMVVADPFRDFVEGVNVRKEVIFECLSTLPANRSWLDTVMPPTGGEWCDR